MNHHTSGHPALRDDTHAAPSPLPGRDRTAAAAPRRRPGFRLAAACAAAAATAVLLSGCGGGSSEHASAETSAASSKDAKDKAGMDGMDATDEMEGMDDKAMGDPSATPADKIADAEITRGAFRLLDTRPPGMDDVTGTAWLAQHKDGTTVTVSLTGLKPGAAYMAHLHAQQCSDDNGGEHFQFEKGGATTPPNEVHLMFKAGKSGKATTTVSNTRKTGEDAVALVVHPREAMDNRIACADFEF
ncbi:superoxide dismutase family protein [Streptomyces sp. F63]|uniref:superoxide dismutase family protein n=1 Tax=Streptomyces sp. F63 TaxID=2824887 RepID=UPI001B386FAC|nr:superoxide dismutase family protein [Streptomyces sp. F63]MBQ0985436.1 superoxide dismutase family protein [Streptomyces sp. F63]